MVSAAKDWERRLEGLARLWRTLGQKLATLEEWLDNAQAILDDTDDDPDSLIRRHKVDPTLFLKHLKKLNLFNRKHAIFIF